KVAVDEILRAIDAAASRFRANSELSRLNADPGREVAVSPLLAQAVAAAMRGARLTGGAVAPTVGLALRLAGYDSDLAAVPGSGGLASSSTTVRRWSRGGVVLHHIIDPSTGMPVKSVWRTATVAAASCVDANIASTAAIVKGRSAVPWLNMLRLPARLVDREGGILRTAGWPRPAHSEPAPTHL